MEIKCMNKVTNVAKSKHMKWHNLFQFLYRKKLTLSSQSESELSGWKKEKRQEWLLFMYY